MMWKLTTLAIAINTSCTCGAPSTRWNVAGRQPRSLAAHHDSGKTRARSDRTGQAQLPCPVLGGAARDATQRGPLASPSCRCHAHLPRKKKSFIFFMTHRGGIFRTQHFIYIGLKSSSTSHSFFPRFPRTQLCQRPACHFKPL